MTESMNGGDRMDSNGGVDRKSLNHESGSSAVEIEIEIERALAEREDAVADALAGGVAKTPEEIAFVAGLRAKWGGTNEVAAVAGGGVLTPMSPTGERERPILRPKFRRWAPMAAAAAVLLGVWFGGGFPSAGSDVQVPGADTGGPSGVYLGADGVVEQVFDGTVDWSESNVGPGGCTLVVRDADPAASDAPDILKPIFVPKESHWTPTPDQLKKLPARFTVEVYASTAARGSAPAWTGLFQLP